MRDAKWPTVVNPLGWFKPLGDTGLMEVLYVRYQPPGQRMKVILSSQPGKQELSFWPSWDDFMQDVSNTDPALAETLSLLTGERGLYALGCDSYVR